MALADFYESTTKKFTVTITYNSTTPDISSDTVTIYFKKSKTQSNSSAVITKTADVASGGASGIAAFTLTDTDTAIEPENYYYEIIWDLATGERYVLESDRIKVLDSITKNN